MAQGDAVVSDASAALEILLPDTATRFEQAAELLERIGTGATIAHVR